MPGVSDPEGKEAHQGRRVQVGKPQLPIRATRVMGVESAAACRGAACRGGAVEGPRGAGALSAILIHLNVPDKGSVPVALLEQGVRAVLTREGVTEGEISVTLLSDEEIREMNHRWLGHDRVTDVIAFALHETGGAPVGDVYVGLEQAERQAQELGLERSEEWLRLVVHGTLHVLGHDHPESGEGRAASPMYRIQEEVVDEVLGRRRGVAEEEG